MASERRYDELAVVSAFVDAQRPPYPHEDFRTFRRARLAALESFYRIRLSSDGVKSARHKSLWMLFHATADSFLGLGGPRSGFLEDSLITTTLDEVDTPALGLRATEARLHSHLTEAREAHLALMTGLLRVLFGPLDPPATSSDLAKLGFDDSTEPRLTDYFDKM